MFTPMIEWSMHFLLHVYEVKNHENHHKNVAIGNFENFKELKKVEKIPPVLMIFCIYFQFWYFLIFLSRYWIVHTCIHFIDFKNPYLKMIRDHHNVHHKYKRYNFSVTAIYPDILFNTRKIMKHDNQKNYLFFK